MSIELYDLIENFVGNNDDVDEVLEALCENWDVPERLYDLYPDTVKEIVFDNLTVDAVLEHEITEVGASDVLQYLFENHKDEFIEFITYNEISMKVD